MVYQENAAIKAARELTSRVDIFIATIRISTTVNCQMSNYFVHDIALKVNKEIRAKEKSHIYAIFPNLALFFRD
jgi:predicted metalloenzyme YecM